MHLDLTIGHVSCLISSFPMPGGGVVGVPVGPSLAFSAFKTWKSLEVQCQLGRVLHFGGFLQVVWETQIYMMVS